MTTTLFKWLHAPKIILNIFLNNCNFNLSRGVKRSVVTTRMTDEELVRHVKSGDMDAFKQLVDRHKNYAYTIANRIVNAPEMAEEVVQDAFVKVYRSADSFKGDAKFTTWFYRVVFNTAVSSGRKNRIQTTDIDEPGVHGGFEYQDELQSDDKKTVFATSLATIE